MRDVPRIAVATIGVALFLAGCAGTDGSDDVPTDPTRETTVTSFESPEPTDDSTEPADDVTVKPTPADVELELFASPSGVVCDLDVMDEYDAPAYPAARWAKCWVPDPQYPASVFDEEQGSVEVACEEDLVMVWPYNSEMWTECKLHQPRDVPMLAEGSTSRSSGFECTIGADLIECLTDDDSGFGFRIGNSLFEGLGQ